MSTAPLMPLDGDSLSSFEQYRLAREILRVEGQALTTLADRLDKVAFCDAVEIIFKTPGNVIVSGMGKAGLIGQKLVATLASTGTRAHYLHPAEAVHGDLGRVRSDDTVIVLSYGGETAEVSRILPTLELFGVPLIAITGKPQSTLGRAATVTLDLGAIREACPLGLAPSTSTTAMLALGDALALVVSRMRNFGPDEFARFHPAGSLGRKLTKVEEVMRPVAECRVAHEARTVREVFVQLSRPGRRSGAIMLTNDLGELTGIFTDSDLARLLEHNRDAAFDGPIGAVMTRSPQAVKLGTLLPEACELLSLRKISELPVVDKLGQPQGLIDITDLVALLPSEPNAANEPR